MKLRCVLPIIAMKSGHTFLMAQQALGAMPRMHGNSTINDFELREDLKLDRVITLSLRTDKPAVSKGEMQ
jgi:hypothetical protein